jgi:hypothetical protein
MAISVPDVPLAGLAQGMLQRAVMPHPNTLGRIVLLLATAAAVIQIIRLILG